MADFVCLGSIDRMPRPANHGPEAPADGCANAPYHSAGTRYEMALQPMAFGGCGFAVLLDVVEVGDFCGLLADTDTDGEIRMITN
jgi:hypothetical protein